MEIKNIVFDVGKVLVYFEPDWIMNRLGFSEDVKNGKLSVDEITEETIGEKLYTEIQKCAILLRNRYLSP